MAKIKLHYPTAVVLEATLRLHLPPKPGDIVLVLDDYSAYIGNFTILAKIDDGNPNTMRFQAPITIDDIKIYYWTHAYKVPEGYASVETSND